MKRAVLTLLLLTTTLSSRAQTEKGRWQTGVQVGNLSYRQFKDDLGYTYSASITPSAGYFLAKNLVVGLTIPLSIDKYKNQTPQGLGNSYYRQLGLGPWLRYYIGNSILRPFAGVDYTYTFGLAKYNSAGAGNYTATTKEYKSNLAPSIGVAYFINRNVLFSIGLSYNFYHEKGENQTNDLTNPVESDYSFKSRSLSLGIGFALLFGN